MNKKRPVNLDPATIFRVLPITAFASLLHRASGIVLLFSTALLLWALDVSLDSETGFKALQDGLQHPLCLLALWITLVAIAGHTIVGIRHIIMDFGYAESLEGGVLGARIVLGLTLILAIVAGVWLLW